MSQCALYLVDVPVVDEAANDSPSELYVEAHSSDAGADTTSPANKMMKYLADNWLSLHKRAFGETEPAALQLREPGLKLLSASGDSYLPSSVERDAITRIEPVPEAT